MLFVDDKLSIPMAEFMFSFSRSAGPGGQHVNKVNTKVTLHWEVNASPDLSAALKERFRARYSRHINKQGQLVLTSQRFRDRGRNVADCLDKLRGMLLEVRHPPKSRRATKPTRSSRERRLKSKRLNSQKKQRRQMPPDKD